MNKEQVQTVIDNLKSVLPYAENNINHLNMRETEIYPKKVKECGTPHCVGGWYAISKGITEGNYRTGADLMAHDLGFEYQGHLEVWAYNNPEIWGNTEGSYMFSSRNSYTPYAISLRDIITHFENLKERLND